MRHLGENAEVGKVSHIDAVVVHESRQRSTVDGHEVQIVKHLSEGAQSLRLQVSRRIGKHKNIVVLALLSARLTEFRLVVVQVNVLAASVSLKPRIINREEFWSQRICHGGFLNRI